jgi:hypothetical protein
MKKAFHYKGTLHHSVAMHEIPLYPTFNKNLLPKHTQPGLLGHFTDLVQGARLQSNPPSHSDSLPVQTCGTPAVAAH